VKSPPQLGHRPANRFSAQSAQKVHSNVQMRASSLSGGSSRSQHSQFGRNSSMTAFWRPLARGATAGGRSINMDTFSMAGESTA
jgi:hypothetical protein